MSEKCCRQTDWVTVYSSYESFIVDWILRWRHAAASSHWTVPAKTNHSCRIQRTVVMWRHWRAIALASTAWLESELERGLAVVEVDCSAVECDHWCSRRPAAVLCCLMTSDKDTSWCQWMSPTRHRSRLLHSPTHTVTDIHTPVSVCSGVSS